MGSHQRSVNPVADPTRWANGETDPSSQRGVPSMRRRLAALAAISALALALNAAPALAGSPATHDSFSPVGMIIHCGPNQYTVVAGTIDVVAHTNDDFATGHLTYASSGLLVQKNDADGNPVGQSYRVVGTQTQGLEATNWNGPATGGTYKYQILGTGDSVNIVSHADPSVPGGYYDVDHGTCAAPGQ